MLDIRATHYVSPLSEVDFASVPLTVHLVNVADETGLVTGRFRVYNDITGTLIHTSDIAPLSLAAGAGIDASALTDFDPPAPLDDTYFVVFDGNAANSLVPDGKGIFLGAFHFDVKPTGMGPAPAAHAATHEDGGSDELDITNLSGLLADPQTPIAHAPSHALAGSDELSHGTLQGLADDDHPQYRLRHKILISAEFSSYYNYPWLLDGTLAGGYSGLTGSALHPGTLQLSSGINANSGARILLLTAPILIAGYETSILWHRPKTLAGTTRHHGFHDATSVTDPIDGVWIWQDPATGIIYGRTRTNSVGSTTGTGYQLVTNTWYCEKIVVNADASRADFYCYAEDGSELWHDFLTTNIPTAAGRELGHGIIATNSGTTSVALDNVDYLSILIPDRRPDL